ncbi:MAG: ABC transporter ATP-binding protein, partial [Candidatus Aphodomonas sp.]|nr:ABC transporter ATP-binding protein [Candidatus Aphodomonas sp.]
MMMTICSFLLTEGLQQAGTQSSLLRVVDACVGQVNEILSLPAMDISGEEIMPHRRALRAENIRFSYERRPIIDGVTLEIPEKSVT